MCSSFKKSVYHSDPLSSGIKHAGQGTSTLPGHLLRDSARPERWNQLRAVPSRLWVRPPPHFTVNNRGGTGAPQQGEKRECSYSKRNTKPKPEEIISEEGTHVHENSKSSLFKDKGMDPSLPGNPGSLSK